MKHTFALLLFVIINTSASYSQKKENGTVYIDHPAINVVNAFEKASVNGDSLEIAGFLTDDFKAYNGTSNVYNDKGMDKTAFVKNALRYQRELDYFAIETFPGSYPDAIEYKKDNKDREVWVQNWDMLKGVHKKTGVKLDAAAHRLYQLNKENKIKVIINYYNTKVLDEIGASFANRTNGTIYNHHDNINTIRKAMYAFEKGDLDKTLSFFTDNARFFNINSEYNKYASKTEIKKLWQDFLNTFEIKSIDVVGYPDYLEYEMNDGREVLSWWKLNLVRKSDKKVITLLLHLSSSFDAKGNIDSQIEYYSDSLLKQK